MPIGIGYPPQAAGAVTVPRRRRPGGGDPGGTLQRALEAYDLLTGPGLQATFEQAAATSFEPQLASLRGVNTRRGIRGPLAGALEGDLTAGFRRDLLAEAARAGAERARGFAGVGGTFADIEAEGRRFGLAEREFGLAERRQQFEEEETARERRRRRRAGVGRFFGGLAGGFLGPFGAAAGEKLGGKLFGEAADDS